MNNKFANQEEEINNMDNFNNDAISEIKKLSTELHSYIEREESLVNENKTIKFYLENYNDKLNNLKSHNKILKKEKQSIKKITIDKIEDLSKKVTIFSEKLNKKDSKIK